MILQDHIRKYFETGLQVIPCVGKRPVYKHWEKFATQEIPDELISEWEKRYANCNIGLVCGPVSNIVAIDVDTMDPEVLKLVPPSPVQRKGRTGRAGVFLYRYNKEVINKNYDDFEILTSGRQFILPPSIHPDTQETYQWISPLEDVEDLPILHPHQIEKLIALGEARKGRKDSRGSTGRNNKLKEMITASRQKGNSDLQVAKEIYDYDLRSHMPRLFTDASEGYPARTEDEAFANAHRMAVSVIKSFDPLSTSNGAFTTNREAIVVRTTKVESGRTHRPEVAKPTQFPVPMGLMGEIFERTIEYSIIPRPAFAMATSIALMSVVTSGRYRFADSNLTTNTYSMIAGKVSQGKGDPQKIIKAVLLHEKMIPRNLLGASKYASREALVSMLPEQRVRLDILDEASSFFTFSKGNERTKLIATELNELWSNGAYPFRTSRAVTRKEVADCVGPQVNLLFAIQPDALVSCMERMLIDNGFLHRFMVFPDDSGVEPNVENMERGVKVDHIVEEILRLFPGHEVFESHFDIGGYPVKVENAARKPRFAPLYPSPQARELLRELSLHYHKSQNDPASTMTYAKAGEHVRKIAMLHALGRGAIGIELDDVVFAKSLLDCTAERNRDLLFEVQATTDFDRKLNRMKSYLIKNRTVSRSRLLQNLHIKSRDLTELIVQSVELGWAQFESGNVRYIGDD